MYASNCGFVKLLTNYCLIKISSSIADSYNIISSCEKILIFLLLFYR